MSNNKLSFVLVADILSKLKEQPFTIETKHK